MDMLHGVYLAENLLGAPVTGVSAFVAPTGQIVRRLALFERGILTSDVPLRERTTLYTRFGDWVAYLGLVVTAGALAVRGLRSPRG